MDVGSEADAAITAGKAKFDGINLLGEEQTDSRFYHPETAELLGWAPFGRELSA